ncbi:TetR/AcrR family transcriptional regulator [Allorhizocola rhizosphaerae]|uniref:TetR/AcrR family transcriptional regulator n=1 Tax=Allorhizocola rhizosphaerae TaxID=1872709 RepID=UPI000E3B679D|nr:TetR/AcrR family transcriptional regulator [Allorhizocola rhizosphaerae]
MSRSNARARILDAALDLFADKGFDATGVQEIVVRAGVTKGALYHHFTSKEDILFSLYGEVLRVQLEDLDRILSTDRDPMWKLRAIIESLVVSTAASAKAAAVVTREMSHVDSGRHQQLKQDWRRYQDSVRTLIRDAQADGRFASAASPEIASWAVFGVVTSLHTWYRPDGPKSARDIAQELADLVLAGLAPKEDHVRVV